jgi:ATP-binding cassette subfamily F protein 3
LHPSSRIGLLGRNGAGKSTLMKTLAGELALLNGERVTGEHLHIGYFSQHQLEALDLDASPALHLQRLSPQATEQSIRDFLGGFNFIGDKALEGIRHFSGGEKARLALAIVVWQKPNLLLLDEPTNHLDLEMRQALALALQDFQGAVVLVSHDRYLMRHTAEELLLVDAGIVGPFDGSLDDYKQWLLQKVQVAPAAESAIVSDEGKLDKKQQRQQAAARRQALAPLLKEQKRIEKRMPQLQQRLSELEAMLSDSEIYNDTNKTRLQEALAEQGALKSELESLEEQWLEVSEQLEEAQ